MKPAPKVFTIDAGLPFLETLARGILARIPWTDDPLSLARVTVLLPTRRAARALSEAFLRVTGRSALLMPVIRPIGDVDEEELAFETGPDDLALPPAISSLERQLILTRMVAAQGRLTQTSFTQLFHLAGALARFLDECHTQGADLTRLEDLVPDRFAEHWQRTLEFLKIITVTWPEVLTAWGQLDPAQRRDQLIRGLSARWSAAAPEDPVIAAGSTGSIPATADLLAVIARLPNGAVVTPGLDRELDQRSWDEIGPEHPQFGLRQLLGRMDVARSDVAPWFVEPAAVPLPTKRGRLRSDDRQLALPLLAPQAAASDDDRSFTARRRLLSEAMRPASATDAWRDVVTESRTQLIEGHLGLLRIDAQQPREEAIAIAAILRETLETPSATAALVTPDRGLARRVASELKRWSIEVDDSAGQPLAHTAPGLFLRHVIEAADEEFAPIALLALIKHPLAACGQERAAFRAAARALDLYALRGLRPKGGLEGLATIVESLKADHPQRGVLAALVRDIASAASPLSSLPASDPIPLPDLARAHVAAAEAFARDAAGVAVELWSGDAGESAAQLMTELIQSSAPDLSLSRSDYAQLVSELMRQRPVRPRFGRHPRLFIWGPLEARLQSADTIVLGGLNEGSWPAETETDPWVSRPMRTELGLEQPERRIGLSAHDFVQLASNRRVYLTRAMKSEGAPTTESRWLTRLQNLLDGAGAGEAWKTSLPLAVATALDRGEIVPAAKSPKPTPPIAARPRRLSVTQIEAWIRDPYGVYARHILKLNRLDPIDKDPGPLERGSIIHRILEDFVRKHPEQFPADAEAKLLAHGERHFLTMDGRNGPKAFWWPRFVRAAAWFLEMEGKRRGGVSRSLVELRGTMQVHGPAGAFTLHGKADRIDILRDGTISILDYKTGRLPTWTQVEVGLSPQLPLEALMAAAGGFGKDAERAVGELAYVRLSGGGRPGEFARRTEGLADLVTDAEQGLLKRIALFDRDSTPYLSRSHVKLISEQRDYDHLARVAEWSTGGDSE